MSSPNLTTPDRVSCDAWSTDFAAVQRVTWLGGAGNARRVKLALTALIAVRGKGAAV